MKLRIRDNSVRLRLTRSEITYLKEKQRLEKSVSFPGGQRLRYAVASLPEIDAIGASFDANTLQVNMPIAVAEAWINSEEISIGATVELGGDDLTLLVEKDFACLSPREGEDESDMFPNPMQGKQSC